MNLVFEKISQFLSAGESLEIGIAGSFFRLSDCAWPCTVILKKGGRVIGSMGNMLAGDYVESVDFDAVQVVNGGMGQEIALQISGGGAGSDRVLGEVSVIDGGKAVTKAGGAFSISMGAAATVGQYGRIQVLNPAGSGRLMVVKSYQVSNFGAGAISVMLTKSIFTNIVGKPGNTKIWSGGAGICEMRREWSATGLAGGRGLDFVAFPAAGYYRRDLHEPVILEEGVAMAIEGQTFNQQITGVFEWVEE